MKRWHLNWNCEHKIKEARIIKAQLRDGRQFILDSSKFNEFVYKPIHGFPSDIVKWRRLSDVEKAAWELGKL